jgi:hypothetical protein
MKREHAKPLSPLKTSTSSRSTCWRLRGKLDVPKERWVSFPHCEGNDGTLMIAWAGYDALQLVRATCLGQKLHPHHACTRCGSTVSSFTRTRRAAWLEVFMTL